VKKLADVSGLEFCLDTAAKVKYFRWILRTDPRSCK